MFRKNFIAQAFGVSALLLTVIAASVSARAQNRTQNPPVQYLYTEGLPPGNVGGLRTLQAPYGTPVDETYFQAVKIMGPAGMWMSPASDGEFLPLMGVPQIYGLNVGKVYRFLVTGIRLYPGVEVFPTIEIVDRTHPPAGEETRYPILIEISDEDLRLAAEGKYVTRVIYIEDPDTALPVVETEEMGQGYFEVAPGSDPLAVADVLGRPVAILRIGGRAPDMSEGPDMSFLYDCPPFILYTPVGR